MARLPMTPSAKRLTADVVAILAETIHAVDGGFGTHYETTPTVDATVMDRLAEADRQDLLWLRALGGYLSAFAAEALAKDHGLASIQTGSFSHPGETLTDSANEIEIRTSLADDDTVEVAFPGGQTARVPRSAIVNPEMLPPREYDER